MWAVAIDFENYDYHLGDIHFISPFFNPEFEIAWWQSVISLLKSRLDNGVWCVHKMDGDVGTDLFCHCSIVQTVRSQEESIIQNHIHVPMEKRFGNNPNQLATGDNTTEVLIIPNGIDGVSIERREKPMIQLKVNAGCGGTEGGRIRGLPRGGETTDQVQRCHLSHRHSSRQPVILWLLYIGLGN